MIYMKTTSDIIATFPRQLRSYFFSRAKGKEKFLLKILTMFYLKKRCYSVDVEKLLIIIILTC
jgi:hypothetical protein